MVIASGTMISRLTFSVGIPSAIKVFNWVSTLYKGDIRLQTGDTRVEISLPSGKKRLFERLGGRQVLTFTDTIEPGFYRVAAAGDSGVLRPRPAEFFVVNIEPSEADLQPPPPSRLVALQRTLSDSGAGTEGSGAPKRQVELWHYLGALLLGLLIGEALLLRQK